MTPPRTDRQGGARPSDEVDDPDDETALSGLESLTPLELALFLGAMISSLLIWLVFIWVHRGAPAVP